MRWVVGVVIAAALGVGGLFLLAGRSPAAGKSAQNHGHAQGHVTQTPVRVGRATATAAAQSRPKIEVSEHGQGSLTPPKSPGIVLEGRSEVDWSFDCHKALTIQPFVMVFRTDDQPQMGAVKVVARVGVYGKGSTRVQVEAGLRWKPYVWTDTTCSWNFTVIG